MRGQFLIVMEADGTLYAYCGGTLFRELFPSDCCEKVICCHCEAAKHPRPSPYRFDGSECFTADCLPSWGVDAYYVENLPISFADCVGK